MYIGPFYFDTKEFNYGGYFIGIAIFLVIFCGGLTAELF